uniref:RPA-interacting protein C-terminal domain-containing protein n=1 Tax=Culex tarsalis TaxID=7177 RepID=A0A1Q3EY54_CULTA
MELVNSPPVYHTSSAQKARSKLAAHRFKYGSPKLVDAMREKCRLRIKEARNQHLFQKRNIIQEEKELLETIVRQELSELEQDIQLQELIFRELIAETDEWLFAEYEKSENYQIDEYGQEQVFCPVCQRSGLKPVAAGTVRCECGVQLRLPGDGQMEPFGRALRNTVEDHGSRCESDLQFFVEPGRNADDCGQLNAFCPGCDYYKNLTN